jgi:hypothetical protein
VTWIINHKRLGVVKLYFDALAFCDLRRMAEKNGMGRSPCHKVKRYSCSAD